MTIAPAPRRFLAAAPAHLLLWGLLTAAGAGFDGRLWLFLVGFVGFTFLGFGWHLFPSLSGRRPMPVFGGGAVWGLAEFATLAGLAGKILPPPLPWGRELFLAGTIGWAATLAAFGGMVVTAERREPPPVAAAERPADRPARWLFLIAWPFGWASAGLWVTSGLADGPGFGYWLAGVHAFLLGQVTLLIFAVSLRLIPRFVGADGPRAFAIAIAVLGVVGAVGMPVALLLTEPAGSQLLGIPGAFEAAAAVLLLAQLVWLSARARTPRRAHAVYLASALCLLAGGAVGLRMVGSGDFALVELHAWTNLLGFVGLMILGMAFSMVAPFQFVSHRWTLRVLAIGAFLLLLALTAFAVAALGGPASSPWASWLGGTATASLGALWLGGSLPVLYSARASPGGRE